MLSEHQEFRNRITEFFGGGRCLLVGKGRAGLYVGLRAMELPRGAGVLMPGYTCIVVPSAVRHAGLLPYYADIDPETYNIDPGMLEASAPADLGALIVQHTYGIPCDVAAIEAWADRRGVPIIEDCCHTFGTRILGRLCGTFGKFAFLSGQWNKPFSTGLGGMLLVNDEALAERAEAVVAREARRPGVLRNMLLKTQILAYDWFVTPETDTLVTKIYRLLNRLGLAVGSSSVGELSGCMPSEYLSEMATCQVRKGLRELARIEENIKHRSEITQFYQQELPSLGFVPLSSKVPEGLPLLRYPVRVANKSEVLARANWEAVEIGSWFETPLHPEHSGGERFGYRVGMCPHAEAACREVINLPTHLRAGRHAAEKALHFLKRFARPLG